VTPGEREDLGHRRYDLLERIAGGGMGEVFLAKAFGAHGFEKDLAIKRILPHLARDREFEGRFIREAKLAAQLNHPNIVQVIDFGHFDGALYMAMEYVDGPDLSSILAACQQRGSRLPIGAAMQMCMALLKGLDYAHRLGIVHRDISPSNVLVSRSGVAKVADFGVAGAAAVLEAPAAKRAVVGKWRYMSPEQARGESLDARSDLFSAGVVLFEVLTGQRLFPAATSREAIDMIATRPIPEVSRVRPDLPAALDVVLDRALDRDPARRFGDAGGFLQALVEISYSQQIVATELEVARALEDLEPFARPTPLAHKGGGVEITRSVPGASGVDTRSPTQIDRPIDRLTAPMMGPPPALGTVVGPFTTPAAAARARRRGAPPALWAAIVGVAAAIISIAGLRLFAGVEPTPAPKEPALIEATAPLADDPPSGSSALEPEVDVVERPETKTEPERSRSEPKPHKEARAAPRYGSIDLFVEPWADVYFRGRKIGEAPIKGLRLPLGHHKLVLLNPIQHRQATLYVDVPSPHPVHVQLP
jgi:serine/threonine-protein kinase